MLLLSSTNTVEVILSIPILYEMVYPRAKKSNLMENFKITESDILLAVKTIKDKLTRTPENIPSYFIKRCIYSIIQPLLYLFNSSLTHGFVPNQWKCSIIVPVYKKGDRNKPLNYRPISLTSSFCRIFELIVSHKILTHLLSNNLLSSFQFGFLPQRSSCDQLLSCLHQWLCSFSSNLTTNIIYTDIRKAFDSVSHPKLIQTLIQYNINPLLITWIEQFLKDRKQQVIINNSLSTPLTVFSGVPQGSIIGPLLFNIYINDITLCSSTLNGSGNIMLFADDAKLFSTNPNQLQISLDKTDSWLHSRQLSLAKDKCFHLQLNKPGISKSQPIDFNFNNNKISHCSIIKDLGIYISEDLKWAPHIY